MKTQFIKTGSYLKSAFVNAFTGNADNRQLNIVAVIISVTVLGILLACGAFHRF